LIAWTGHLKIVSGLLFYQRQFLCLFRANSWKERQLGIYRFRLALF